MIYLDDRQEKFQVTDEFNEKIKEIINFSLEKEGVNVPYEISIIYVDNKGIRAINKENRNIDNETDVLSFPMLHYEDKKVFKEVYSGKEFKEVDLDDGYLVLGDIVLSLEKAERQSREFNHSFLREACYLTVHSVLHLMGYDHIRADEKMAMRKREEEILEKFNITRE